MTAGTDDRKIHLRDYWRIVWEGRRILLGTLTITCLVAFFGTLKLSKQYRVTLLL